jgi:tRNA (guanine26-N2/guanine27-N2)-dimethyltransferase
VIKHKDANRLLAEHSAPKKRFDVVDIDPFGTPVPHLDNSIQALRNNGMLAATATDMAPLCGVHPKACNRKYGGKPLRTEYCQELAVRFLAGAIAQAAARHDIGVKIPFSHCSDHYIRVYAQIGYGRQRADISLRNVGYILHCFKCLHREIARKPFPETAIKCPECGNRMDYAGPLWTGKLFETEFIKKMIDESHKRPFRNSAKINKLLTLIDEEAGASATYYIVDKLSQKLKLPAPAMSTYIQALRDAGIKVSLTHFNSRGVRSDSSSLLMQETLKHVISVS